MFGQRNFGIDFFLERDEVKRSGLAELLSRNSTRTDCETRVR